MSVRSAPPETERSGSSTPVGREGVAVLCWWAVTVLALLQGADYAGRWRRHRRRCRGAHRGRRGTMREWPGGRPEP
ncbi:hypothetical protein BJ983_002851 [Actinomycetospora corticicola]|uniref:Uncharacterized protein n=1 Tax=Actinomycetospora corticicola TaxID=663602 RepID=A0A7Y9DWL3_9PSEU|nr:hypothetical protein [Actinomycetospora corticicola]